MNGTIYLDPKKMAPLEPSQRDERNESWISPFEIPKSAHLFCEAGFADIRAVRFEYSGGETGESRMPLDERDDPAILVRYGRHSGKILELTFGRAIPLASLPSVGERLKLRARSKMIATRFNYEMIAAIFENWSDLTEGAE